ncbi:MAG TPA: bifunctional phosphopantothenoylcysteine decarboxylase/phosphopantothenate--cysteine ligase CoaBC [Solirubrobacteraceae bacterium]|jgi:phosphopantothenoylcysteine decarboxylase/phosphopantothenate--cysteine ligase|nr:bifunctional phosphopantothenoylcysteine decarboxylase/phosphopantothenate--cysteine ligase CoaBC [Solirubrobacteraceae bacterium]
MARILLGVSGGIAAYKALEVVRLATAAGHAVRVIQTPASRRFVGEASFAALTGAPVLTSEFQRDPARGGFPGQPTPSHEPLSHLELVANADIYLIAPATANTLAKLAGGLADNLLTSAALAARCPLIVAPAMNNHMWEHPATQTNLRTLAERGVTVVPPGEGRLASRGEQGVGRLAEPPELLAACEAVLAGGDGGANGRVASLAGTRVLVTAGGTREPIDSVRFVGNSSSGRMGYALAEAAIARGAEVTLVAANVALPAPAGAELHAVSTAAELGRVCEREFSACDVLLMAAAVADFAPEQPAHDKLKKAGRDSLELVLAPTADILSALSARRRDGQTLVGFAAEHGAQAALAARSKLAAKGLDALVVNDISRADIGFDSAENEVTIVSASQNGAIAERHVARTSKTAVAEAVLDAVEELRGAG